MVELRSSIGLTRKTRLHSTLLHSEWSADALLALRRLTSRPQEPSERRAVLNFSFQVVQRVLEKQSPPLKRGAEVVTTSWNSLVVQSCMEVMLLGVTDVWSAVRKECARQAASLVLILPSLDAIDSFVDRLLRVAAGTERIGQEKSHQTLWSEQDGALYTLSLILGSVRVERRVLVGQLTGTAATASTPSRVTSDIKGGFAGATNSSIRFRFGERYTSVSRLPRSLLQSLKPVLYQCLRHEQLSVRENAAQCLKHHVDLCEEPMRLLVFQEVMSKLNRMRDSGSGGAASDVSNDQELLEAYEAEGLLDVLAKVAPSLPSSFLLKHWKFVFPTLERYVVHIASSVRQKSSAVVLSFAKLSQAALESANAAVTGGDSSSTATALELLLEMMVGLSKPASNSDDISSCCWQQKEGRLLSIEALTNLLGEDLLFRKYGLNALHSFGDGPPRGSLREGELDPDSEDRFWACSRVAMATWTVGDEELSTLNAPTRESEHAVRREKPKQSLVDALDDFLASKLAKGSERRPKEFWQGVLTGWFKQTQLAFVSNQFELRRISRQVLPGLVRLTVWTKQPEVLLLREVSGDDDEGWRWTSLKFSLLHLQFLSQSAGAKRILSTEELTKTIESGLEAAWSVLADATTVDSTRGSALSAIDAEIAVVRAEAQAMGFLSFCSSDNKLVVAVALLEQCLDTVCSNLPPHMQLVPSGAAIRSRGDVSVDRQLSISLVGLLPAIARALESIDRHRVAVTSSSEMRTKCWLILERAALAWLAADDMFRWITVSQSDAHAALLRALRQLLENVPTGVDDIDKECLLALTQLAASRCSASQAALTQVLSVHLSLWRASSASGAARFQCSSAVVRLYSQLVSFCNSSSDRCSEQSSWDDWDGVDDSRSSSHEPTKEAELRATTTASAWLASGDPIEVADQVVATVLSKWRPDELASLCACITSGEEGTCSSEEELQHGGALVALVQRLRRREGHESY